MNSSPEYGPFHELETLLIDSNSGTGASANEHVRDFGKHFRILRSESVRTSMGFSQNKWVNTSFSGFGHLVNLSNWASSLHYLFQDHGKAPFEQEYVLFLATIKQANLNKSGFIYIYSSFFTFCQTELFKNRF